MTSNNLRSHVHIKLEYHISCKKVIKYTIHGSVKITLFKSNSNFIEVVHFHVPQNIKHKITAKIYDGVSLGSILDNRDMSINCIIIT